MTDDKTLYQQLLEKKFEIPKDTVFKEHTFRYICTRLTTRNETTIMQTIHRLIIPSAEIEAHRGHTGFKHLIDSIKESWNHSNSLDGPARLPTRKVLRYRLPNPQPDYAVGFKEHAFDSNQIQKLQAYVGELNDTSFFKGTSNMFFPFFTAEEKARTGSLEATDKANAHSSAIAVRGVIELFKTVKRENELPWKILAFSISHNYKSVSIYAHYPAVIGEKVTYYRHTIDEFSFTFCHAMYNIWVPFQFKLLFSAIDDLPDINFDALPSLPSDSSRPSPAFESVSS
ncbi:hypothetical protein BDW59DRAFT_171262 [Aspergillus cavernicola]|uniref:DUF7924 domain-containing protein n=1 Tax=Aspergillus cavernicola TaxID=176166 RepID=A0ABR4IJ99_9EURO